ncbi:hydroxysteroid dehydrogenase-like protein 1 [Drosophila sulfurigaster albostrigata]|uniref:hydroxysteroid dehydrogenase-like protein 1 n=1 Tax=Drosophila sulfurigaster albostrigata TaxID=89887 RepID=UPI002D21C109|nr:hydroxysteroid dehydrogenase-like protein 1 [Drosophila sulfurigaster albostrigata]
MLSAFLTFLTLIGLYALICFLYEQLRTPLRLLKVRLFDDRCKCLSLKDRFGDWAAVTGSSDGIGKEYAKELARNGINVVLIARNEAKLKAVANEIMQSYFIIVQESKVETKIIVADFTQGAEVYEHIERELADIPIVIFVNNVGIGFPGALCSLTKEHVEQLIDTNIVTVSQLSRYFIKRLRDSQMKGAIVNLGSVTENQPAPFGAVYAASKAYIRSFTLALGHEVARYGIHVQLLSPGFVVTNMNNYSTRIMKGNLFAPSAEAYARSAVAQLRAGVDETPGYLWHHVQYAAFMLLPCRLRVVVSQLILKLITDKQLE